MGSLWNRPVEILLVDDDALSLYLMERSLRESRISSRVSSVKDGQEAVDFLTRAGSYSAARRPDLVFLDLHLPRKSGFEVLAEIKADSLLRRIPIIVMTSSCEQQDVNAVYDLHANCYLRKPADLEELGRLTRSIEEFWFGMALWPTTEPVVVDLD